MTSFKNNKIEAQESDYLFRATSQIPNSGEGLFTAIDLYKDETISIFKGEILTDSEASQRVAEGIDNYFINLLDGSIMDSKNVKCFAKYANDAEGFAKSSFKNNARITLDENNTPCIEAIRDIKANEELFCSYGKRYWKKHGKMCDL